jgi:hypothetical protein
LRRQRRRTSATPKLKSTNCGVASNPSFLPSDEDDAAANDDDGGSPAKTEFDRRRDWRCCCSGRRTRWQQRVGRSSPPTPRRLQRPRRIIQTSGSWRCMPFSTHGTSPDRCFGAGVAPTASPTRCCSLMFVSLFVGGAITARRSQRRWRSHARVVMSTTTHHRSRRGRSRRRRGGRGLFVGGAITARRSQQRRRSHSRVFMSTTTHHRSRRGRSRRRRGERNQGLLRRRLRRRRRRALSGWGRAAVREGLGESRSSIGCCRRAAVLLRITTRTKQQSNDRTGAASRSALTVRRSLTIDRSLVLVAGLRRRLHRAAAPSRSSRRFLLACVDGEIKARRSQRRRGSHAWVYTGATTAKHRSRLGRDADNDERDAEAEFYQLRSMDAAEQLLLQSLRFCLRIQ